MPRKWKSCVEKVSSKQSQWCKDNKFPLSNDPSGKKCVHPYKVCSYLRNQYDPEELSNVKEQEIFIGPRGGRYYFNPSGKKIYLKRE